MFCALLEFALVNYASRSDMQRDRARERNERARRQWELEHADMQQIPGSNGPDTTPGSQTPGTNKMNHIGGSSEVLDGYSLVSVLVVCIYYFMNSLEPNFHPKFSFKLHYFFPILAHFQDPKKRVR